MAKIIRYANRLGVVVFECENTIVVLYGYNKIEYQRLKDDNEKYETWVTINEKEGQKYDVRETSILRYYVPVNKENIILLNNKRR